MVICGSRKHTLFEMFLIASNNVINMNHNFNLSLTIWVLYALIDMWIEMCHKLELGLILLHKPGRLRLHADITHTNKKITMSQYRKSN